MAGYKKGTVGWWLQQQKYRQTMLSKFNSEDEMKAYYRTIAAKGGRNGHTGGFSNNSVAAALAGKKGGSISSRSKNKLPLEERRQRYEESS